MLILKDDTELLEMVDIKYLTPLSSYTVLKPRIQWQLLLYILTLTLVQSFKALQVSSSYKSGTDNFIYLNIPCTEERTQSSAMQLHILARHTTSTHISLQQ